MNGLDLYNFMYDQFVWPQYPFASRDVRPKLTEREPNAAGEASAYGAANSQTSIGAPVPASSRSVIVLADRRRKETT